MRWSPDNPVTEIFRTLESVALGAWTIGVVDFDLTISHVEVVQVVQTLDNTVPLIANKPTVARVFTKTLGERTVSNVDVVLTGSRGGIDLGQRTETERSFPAPDRREETHSHNFTLPSSWTTSGPLRLTAEVNADKKPMERDFKNNEAIVDVNFEQTHELRVGYVDLCVSFPFGSELYCPSPSKVDPGLALRKLYPVENPKIRVFPLPGSPWRWTALPVITLTGFMANLFYLQSKLDEAFWLLASNSPDGVPPIDRLIAYVSDEAFPVASLGGGVFFLGGRGGSRSVWLTNATSSARWTQFTVAHELGHTYGLSHPSTDDSGIFLPEPFSIWPFTSAALQEHGYDPSARVVKVGWPPTDSRVKYDFMSYRDEKKLWISKFYYLRLFHRFKFGLVKGLSEAGQATGGSARRQSGPRQTAFFTGTIDRDSSEGTLDPALIFNTTALPDEPDPTQETCLEFSGSSGILGTHCFAVTFVDTESGIEVDEAAFSAAVAFPDGVTLVRLRHQGAELATLANSANAPTVEITSPQAGATWNAAVDQTLSWTAQDVDGDPLVFDASYSSDGGNTWLPLDLGTLTEPNLTFSPSSIVGGSNVRFRVRARDGLRSATAEVGPIDVIQNPLLEAADPTELGRIAVGLSKVGLVELRNPGSGPVRVDSLQTDNALFEPIDTTFPQEIPAGATSTVPLRFSPDEIGDHEATVTAVSNATNAPELKFTVRAEADDGQTPTLAVDALALNFRPVPLGQQNRYGLLLRNESLVAVTGSIAVTGTGFSLAEPTAEFSLVGGEERTLEFLFEPQTEDGVQGEARIESNDPARPVTTVELSGFGYVLPPTGPPGPRISPGGIVDAAQFQAVVARGGIGSIFGSELADDIVIAGDVPLPFELGGARVRVDGWEAPLFFVSPGQINFQVPFEADSPGEVGVVVIRNGEESPTEPASMAEFAPEVFINPNTGEPIIQRHPDGALITAANPAKPGDVLIIFMTGIGGVSNPPATGAAAAASPLAQARVTPVVTVGGEGAQVFFAGLAPFFVGLGQVNIQLPESLVTTGATMPLMIDFEGSRNPPVNLPVLFEQ